MLRINMRWAWYLSKLWEYPAPWSLGVVHAELLCGWLDPTTDHYIHIMVLCKQCQHLPAVEFACDLLIAQPEHRPSAKEALRREFLWCRRAIGLWPYYQRWTRNYPTPRHRPYCCQVLLMRTRRSNTMAL